MKKLMDYEKRNEPLATHARFRARLMNNLTIGLATIVVSLAIGMAGYAGLEDMSLIDAFANSAMILSGMGPLNPLHSNAGKLFAGLYAIFCGLLIFAVAGLILAPVLHRILHRFHIEDAKE
jgi:hypothetical protein